MPDFWTHSPRSQPRTHRLKSAIGTTRTGPPAPVHHLAASPSQPADQDGHNIMI